MEIEQHQRGEGKDEETKSKPPHTTNKKQNEKKKREKSLDWNIVGRHHKSDTSDYALADILFVQQKMEGEKKTKTKTDR